MLPRSLRLSRAGFEEAKGLRKIHTPHFTISYGTAAPLRGGSAIIVPKKAVKSAVGRHLLKRRIRAVLLPFSSKDRVLIVSAKASAYTLSFEECKKELSEALSAILN